MRALLIFLNVVVMLGTLVWWAESMVARFGTVFGRAAVSVLALAIVAFRVNSTVNLFVYPERIDLFHWHDVAVLALLAVGTILFALALPIEVRRRRQFVAERIVHVERITGTASSGR